jgi:hypothetical protein
VGDPEVLAFNERHPDNGTWHFVNLPLGMTGYARARAFPSRRNIVEQIADCIRILEAPPGAKLSMPKAQALRMLIHLVGDLHQPLHVGTGYYAFTPDDRPVLVTDPGRARGKSSDRGGNLLRWGREPGETLHGDWDVAIPRRIVNSPGPEALAARLRAEAVAVPLSTPGDYRTRWARQWAGESLKLAANAYRDVAFGPVTRDPQGRLEFIAIGFLPDRDTYLDASVPVASDQLTKAAVRLAALLNRIAWR